MTFLLRRGAWLGVLLAMLAGVASAETPARTRSGRSIYSVSCASCHSHGMRGAPQVTDPAAWAPRLAQGKDTIYRHVIDGLGWMPRRGTCFTCSDDEVKAAVDYLLSQVK
jgi:cytochrome c5